MTAQELNKRADQLHRKIMRGELKGEKARLAKHRMYNLRYQARKLRDTIRGEKASKGFSKAERDAAKKEALAKIRAAQKAKKNHNPNQGFLPGFSEQVQLRINEAAADLVFQALQQAVNNAVQNLVKRSS